MAQSQRSAETPVLAGLVLVGVTAIVLGIMNLQRFIGPQVYSSVASSTTDDDADRRALAALDTDGDGLTDLEELERIFSSPYLADSDSDGRTDREEVAAGEDPNCPTGSVCTSAFRADAAPEPDAAVPVVPAPRSPDLSRSFTDAFRAPSKTPPSQSPDVDTLFRNLPTTPSAIRSALRQSGVSEAQLNALDDAALLKLWEESIRSLRQMSNSVSPAE